ncbi:response regulator transcription factor [Microvirga sp. VF16]|uniref:LuxR C-terminal-related transcriptional regulator n=1 Tax=Microvirga sp. VF16 TaxID=2807101 RepID=UPI00193E449D|nr:response regulator transcription factor [Microvirga sp. VF16]QRM35490.1 response regulator transcription factor [Microvirga sp. VF16]
MLRDEYGCAADPVVETAAASGASNPVIETMLLGGSSLLRAGLTHLLAGTRFAVVDRHEDAALSDEIGAKLALFIVDASGSSDQTLAFLDAAKRQNPTARVVLIANSFDLGLIRLAVSREVDSFCAATGEREVLINILELTMLGEQVLPGATLQALLNQVPATSSAAQGSSATELTSSDPRAGKLSPREMVILQSLMGGEANKVIARKLDITEATIKVHVKSILRKIGAANRTQAAMWASENLRTADRPLINAQHLIRG